MDTEHADALVNIASSQKYQEKQYWLNKFSGELLKSTFFPDNETKDLDHCAGDSIKFEFSLEIVEKLLKLSNGSNLKLYMILLAALVLLLNKYSGNLDIVVGSPVLDQKKEVKFINTVLPLRIQLHENMTFKELLLEVKQTVVEATENQNYPIKVLVNQLNMPWIEKEFPLFDVALLLKNIHCKEYLRQINFNVLFTFQNSGQSIGGEIEYNQQRYEKSTIERLITHLESILHKVFSNINVKISNLDLLSEEEKKQMLFDFNDTAEAYPKDKTLHRLFEEQVERTPDQVALVGPKLQNTKYKLQTNPGLQIKNDKQSGALQADFDAFGEIQLSYGLLNEQSNRLAYMLIGKGVIPDTIVGIMVQRSVEMIVGIMGILKSGGAYLPIDPDCPKERIDYMLKDSGVKILLKNNDLKPITPSTLPPFLPSSPLNLAYVIYTSGITGKSKGVLVEHRNAVNVVNWYVNMHKVGRTSRILQVSDYTFDASVDQIFGAMIPGAILYIVEKEIRLDTEKLRHYIIDHTVNLIDSVPTHLKELLCYNDKLESLRTVISGGEKLDDATKEAIIERGYRLVNQYGPTETTVDALALECSLGRVSMGKPISNVKVYILDRYETVLPIGVVGELYISGAGVARGYLNRPGLTAERFKRAVNSHSSLVISSSEEFSKSTNDHSSKFSPHDQCPMTNDRLYKTGDLARWQPDGNIYFLGRIDHQVKIRGFRIELGEIENHLLAFEGVKEAVVLSRANKSGDKYLCAYIVSKLQLNLSALKEFLSRKLLDYMIPAYFVPLERIPLNPNGKVDRTALPSPEILIEKWYVAPQDEVEKKLVEIWSEVLGIEKMKISIDANFFGLGGHSLRVAAVISAIAGKMGIQVPLIEFFRTPTVRQLAQYIKNDRQDIAVISDKHLVLLKRSNTNDGHLFFIHDGTGEVEGYMELCDYLTHGLNYWGIRAHRLENYTPVKTSIEEAAGRYIRILRQVQPQGPYRIVGWSLGGVIAFEIAMQLEAAGGTETFLGLIDAPNLQSGGSEPSPPFSVETEVNLIMDYWPDDQIKEKLKHVSRIDEIWTSVVNHLEENNFGVDTIKSLIPGNLARTIPNYNQADIRELIYYLNMYRTLSDALSRYHPDGKINAAIHYFKASQSPGIIKEGWNDYCSKSIEVYEIEGDHFSILKRPSITRLGEIVKMLLKTGTG